MPNHTTEEYKNLATECRKKVLEMIHRAGTSHIASNFSAIDIATVLYENLKEGDEVVWSKGWAAATIYYFLSKQGKIPIEDLDKFPNPPYLGLAETSVPGVLVSGGSMGHGLPIAVGMALGKKRAGEKGKIYCIMSDGEMNEGTTWESAALASHHRLDNLVVLIDKNGWQAMGKTEEILDLEHHNEGTARLVWPDNPGLGIQRKFLNFNWETYRCNGHNYNEIEKLILYKKIGPCIIICNTIKGKGVSFFEDHLLYHYKHVDDEEYKKALKELNG